ncbi:MAG TPA: hypothetical protein DEO88_14330 [Syntrophobacteraceae bacterium]|nr:hypothetical protein [Syntrophobacteraceae bacterium]
MKNQSTIIAGGLVVLLALISGVSAYRSYRTMGQQVIEDRRVLQSLQTEIARINTQLADVKGKLAKIPDRPIQLSDLPPPPMDMSDPSSRRLPPPPPVFQQGNEPNGGNALTATPPPPRAMPQNIGSERVATYRKELIERNAQLHQADQAIYGDEVAELYKAARTSPTSGGTSESSNTALNKLLSDYPQSNAAAMVLSEKALQAASQANTVVAEQYYKNLTTNENFSSAVTDSGVEAKPALTAYLAYQYVQQNRFTEANTLLQSLEQNYSSALLATPGPQGQMQYRSVTDTVKVLRSQMGTSTSAGK